MNELLNEWKTSSQAPSYAPNPKLWITYFLTYWRGWGVELLAYLKTQQFCSYKHLAWGFHYQVEYASGGISLKMKTSENVFLEHNIGERKKEEY